MAEYIVGNGSKLAYEIDGEGGMYITVPDTAEQIVRCRDCVYREYKRCWNPRFIGCATDPNGFCHEGKLRRDA